MRGHGRRRRVLVIGELNPAIVVKKTPSATRVQGSKVTHLRGEQRRDHAVGRHRVTDDKCAPVTYVKGDDNGDGLVTVIANGENYPDEMWTYVHDRHHAGYHQHGGRKGAPWEAGQIVGTDVSARRTRRW